MNYTYLSIVLVFFCCNLSFGSERESDWLSNKAGASESKLGARVESVEKTDNGQRIKVSVPSDNKILEEVLVVGKRQNKLNLNQAIFKIHNIEVINDLESGRSGIIFYLGERGDFVFRLNYQEADPLYKQRQSISDSK